MEILLFVIILILKQGQTHAAAVFLSCPTNTLNSSIDNFITGWFDSSVLAGASCALPVAKNEFVLRKASVETKICDQDFSPSTVICNTNYNAQNCKCDYNFGTNYSYTLKLVANSVYNAGEIILRSDCVNSGFQYLFQSQPCFPDFGTTLPIITTPTTTAPTTTTETPECENCICNGTCKCPDNCSPCPRWCIIVASVCVPVGVFLIIAIIVIIIKCKKVKRRRNRSLATHAEAGNNRNVQDAKEMQDRNKHLGTDNSPEREKRRKEKRKTKTLQEVDGEYVPREEKSTVSDHKDTVNESSHAIDNGGHRSLPMPKISHMTSVERNSTIFQSETPRKLPPLQPKQ